MQTTFAQFDFGCVALSYTEHETRLGTFFAVLHHVELHIDDGESMVIKPNKRNKQKFFDLLCQNSSHTKVFDSVEDAIDDEKTWHEFYEVEDA